MKFIKTYGLKTNFSIIDECNFHLKITKREIYLFHVRRVSGPHNKLIIIRDSISIKKTRSDFLKKNKNYLIPVIAKYNFLYINKHFYNNIFFNLGKIIIQILNNYKLNMLNIVQIPVVYVRKLQIYLIYTKNMNFNVDMLSEKFRTTRAIKDSCGIIIINVLKKDHIKIIYSKNSATLQSCSIGMSAFELGISSSKILIQSEKDCHYIKINEQTKEILFCKEI
jgi:hypothetical protein